MDRTRLVCLFLGITAFGFVFFPSVAKAGVGVSPSSVNFGTVTVNTTSATTLVLTNTGSSSFVISNVLSNSPQFAVSGITLPLTLSGHASTSVSVLFAPNAAANFTGVITIEGGHRGSNSTVASIGVSGSGVAPAPALTYQLSLSTGGLGFGNQAVGTTGTLPLTLTNTGTGSVTVSQVSASGTGFSISGFSAPVTLAPGKNVSMSVAFSPTSVTNYTGSVTVVSTASNSPVSFPLSGNGTAALTYQLSLSTGGLGFGNQAVGTTGTLPLTLTNTGTGSVTVSQVSASGTGFGISGFSAPVTLAPGKNVSMSVTFSPTSVANYTGSVTVVSTASNSPVSFPLSGNGVAALTYQLSLSTGSLGFGNQAVGTTGTLPLTLTNTGTGSVTVSQVSVTGTGFGVSGFSGQVTLAAGQTLSLGVTFAPTSVASFTGSVTVTSTATNSPSSAQLTGSGVSSQTYQLSLSTGGLGFGSQAVGTTGTLPLTLTNTGTGSVTVSQVSASGTGFGISGFSGPVTLPPGNNISMSVTFTPTGTGDFTGTVTVVSTATNSPVSFPLSGKGVASTAQLSASSGSLGFGNVLAGSSATLSVSVSNSGTSSVTISQFAESGAGYTLTGTPAVPLTLSAGQSASFSVKFAPTATGTFAGTVTVTSNATNPSLNISLSGAGVQPQIAVVPAGVSFGNVAVGVTNTQAITIQNPGTASLSISQGSVSGTGFSISGLALPLSIAPGASASFSAAFAPASTGSLSGAVTLMSNAPNSPTTIALSGSGATSTYQLSANPTSLAFGSLTDGTSATQTVTLSNTGNASVAISQITASGTGFNLSSIGLPVTLAAGQTTSFGVTFAPASAGSATGGVTVTSNAANSPLVLALSGTGTSPAAYSVALSWTPSSSTYSGFNVYRGSVSGGPYTKIDTSLVASPSYTDSSVTSGQTYYYVATEVDSTGMESGYSSQVSAAIP